ncbi:MAG: hypothetical protein VYB49_04315 [Actinomycetota bacterium]|nr:hypothetical protein [Actinomycetota bacterium]
MSSPETFLAFAAIMLIIALIGVAIDWFGTPLRHRKFIPKAYKFPDERLFRSDVFSSARRVDTETRTEHLEGSNYRDEFGVIESENVQTESSANEDINEAAVDISESSKGEVKLSAKSSAGEETIDRGSELMIGAVFEPAKSSEEPEFETTTAGIRLRGWSPGDDIYNLTKSGSEPTPSTVRSRFWKNVGVSPGAIIFGTSNVERYVMGSHPNEEIQEHRNTRL